MKKLIILKIMSFSIMLFINKKLCKSFINFRKYLGRKVFIFFAEQ